MKANQGSSGVDVITIEDIEAGGVNRYLIGIQLELKSGAYKPLPVRRVMIPKPDGSQRPLGIPCVKDRIVQMAKIQEMCGFTKQQAIRNFALCKGWDTWRSGTVIDFGHILVYI